MATADQLKSLIKSHFEDDRERFSTIALQLAAHEARQGHSALAHEIRTSVERGTARSVRLFPAHQEYDNIFEMWEPTQRLSDMIINAATKRRLERVILEYRQLDRLKRHGLENRRKLLIFGPPGTGKTMTAQVLAFELGLPLLTVLTDKLVTKYMGETSAKLRVVFECMEERKGVYLFDEFDAIGGEREQSNDVGEIRRVLNSFLQFIERDQSDSLIIAATNNIRLLDQALFRRFDDVIRYDVPTDSEAKRLMANRLGIFKSQSLSFSSAIKDQLPLSHAEISQACDDAIKEAILSGRDKVTTTLLRDMLYDRRTAYETERE
ncbi:ATPase [Capsulimonas corticalis]|uniref:ATPase n=1 Tax=Capsulimonas corticalis TaxID=2219043 RepID=A0A402CU12_9BACT|nr:ATP-binding protein [Capsulimonas corticalis]BDI28802.1 ATPase [Capsulimonas corticalis]